MNLKPGNWSNLLEKGIALISGVFNSIGMVCLVPLMLVITVDVILRVALNRPLLGANEMAEFLMIFVVFLSMAWVQHKKGHIEIDLIYIKFPKRAQAIVSCFTYFLSLVIISLMAWQAFAFFSSLRNTGRVSDVLFVPIAPIESIMIVGFVMFSLVLLVDFIHSLQNSLRRATKP